MPISKYDTATSSEKNNDNEPVSFSATNESANTSTIVHNSVFSTSSDNNNNNNTTSVTENRRNNNNNIAIRTTAINNDHTMNTLANKSMHSGNEIIYANGSYDASGFSYLPPAMTDGTTTHIDNKRDLSSYQYAYEHKGPLGSETSPKTYERSQLETLAYDNVSNTYNNRPYDTYNNVIWKNNGYYLENDHHAELPIQEENNGLNKTCNVNYMHEPQIGTIPAMHRTAPIKMKRETNPAYAPTDIAFYASKHVSPMKHHKVEGYATTAPDAPPYVSSPMTSYGETTSPRYVSCKVNPIVNKSYDPQFKQNGPINYAMYPPYPFVNSNYEGVSSNHMQYDQMRPMMVPSPNAPVSYVVMKEGDKRCILQKGIEYAMNSCKGSRNPQYSKHEYFIKGVRGPSVGGALPYITFQENKKFDVFKKLTLKVGTCLDDLINVFIESLNSSMEVLHKNNEVRLHDLHPFYNPDPVYTRPERPTLKTGNNLIDNINTALDGTTLEKHKNIPKPNERIPIPKTEKTGHVVVDGLNNILDNLLNEPLSYQKYDYYSDKVNIASRSK